MKYVESGTQEAYTTVDLSPCTEYFVMLRNGASVSIEKEKHKKKTQKNTNKIWHKTIKCSWQLFNSFFFVIFCSCFVLSFDSKVLRRNFRLTSILLNLFCNLQFFFFEIKMVGAHCKWQYHQGDRHTHCGVGALSLIWFYTERMIQALWNACNAHKYGRRNADSWILPSKWSGVGNVTHW